MASVMQQIFESLTGYGGCAKSAATEYHDPETCTIGELEYMVDGEANYHDYLITDWEKTFVATAIMAKRTAKGDNEIYALYNLLRDK